MTPSELFDALDLNRDGALSRSELHAAAKQFGWHWPEAPLFALLDLFSVVKPLSKSFFMTILEQINHDPLGVYGQVLLKSPHFLGPTMPKRTAHPAGFISKKNNEDINLSPAGLKMRSLLLEYAGNAAADAYLTLQNDLNLIRLAPNDAALLLIDPQKSFTTGVWMRSTGRKPHINVGPIRLAFDNCSKLLGQLYGKMEVMFTRCPFPPSSYPWDNRLSAILDRKQLYFIKPGNSVLFPPTNGFQEWMARCIKSQRHILVIGGCTLNSCLRVSAIETFKQFHHHPLQVVVDLSLSGARITNYQPSPRYDGQSAVASAIRQMRNAGIKVVKQVLWGL
jgi:hypothetical protein